MTAFSHRFQWCKKGLCLKTLGIWHLWIHGAASCPHPSPPPEGEGAGECGLWTLACAPLKQALGFHSLPLWGRAGVGASRVTAFSDSKNIAAFSHRFQWCKKGCALKPWALGVC